VLLAETPHPDVPLRGASAGGQALDHRDERMANWQRGLDLVPLEMIAGADVDD
jgi:hypothetical protein